VLGHATIHEVCEADRRWLDAGHDAGRRSSSGCSPKLTPKPLFPMAMKEKRGVEESEED